MDFLCEYDFDINHIKGKENKVAGVLSRKIHLMHVATINTGTSDLKDMINESSVTDEIYKQVKEGLQQQKIPQKIGRHNLE